MIWASIDHGRSRSYESSAIRTGNPGDADGLLQSRWLAYNDLGEYERAIAVSYDAAIRLNPGDADGLRDAGQETRQQQGLYNRSHFRILAKPSASRP